MVMPQMPVCFLVANSFHSLSPFKGDVVLQLNLTIVYRNHILIYDSSKQHGALGLLMPGGLGGKSSSILHLSNSR